MHKDQADINRCCGITAELRLASPYTGASVNRAGDTGVYSETNLAAQGGHGACDVRMLPLRHSSHVVETQSDALFVTSSISLTPASHWPVSLARMPRAAASLRQDRACVQQPGRTHLHGPCARRRLPAVLVAVRAPAAGMRQVVADAGCDFAPSWLSSGTRHRVCS